MSYRQSYRAGNITATSANVNVVAEDAEGDEAVVVTTTGLTEKVPLSTIGAGPANEPNLVLSVGTGGVTSVGPQPDYNNTESVTDGIRIVEPRRAPEWDRTDFPGCRPAVYNTLNYNRAITWDNYSFPMRHGRLTFTYTPRARMFNAEWRTVNGRAKQDVGRITASSSNEITIAGKNWTTNEFAGGYLFLDKDLIMTQDVKLDLLASVANETPQGIVCTTDNTLQMQQDGTYSLATNAYSGSYITIEEPGGYRETLQVKSNTADTFTMVANWAINPSQDAKFTCDGPVQGATKATSNTPGTHLRYDVQSNTANTITTTSPMSQTWRAVGAHAHVFKEFADPYIHSWLMSMPQASGSPWMDVRLYYIRVNPTTNVEIEGGDYPDPSTHFVQWKFQQQGAPNKFYYASTPQLAEWVPDQAYDFDLTWEQPVSPGPVRLTMKIDDIPHIDESTQDLTLPDYVTQPRLRFGQRDDLQSAEYGFPAQNNMQGDMTNIKLYDLTT